MTLKEFWEHIQKTRRIDPDAHVERLISRLSKLSAAKALAFEYRWNVLHRAAYNWNLWGAAYLINGGCSDDGFEYFRDWLMLQGRTVYEAALRDPDSLADVIDPDDSDVEMFCQPGQDAWFRATETERDDDGYAAFEAAYAARYPDRPRLPRLGGRWNHDSDRQMKKRLPRLWALYNDEDEE